jgi:2,3-dihydro-2,3-dihydroxybenzoate dehydrogenase
VTALVTGAAHGIGAAVAAAFAREGRPVALLDRDEAVSETAAEHGGLALVADVTDPAAVEAAVARAEAELGPVEVLANVAGILRTGGILDLPDAALADSLAVNTVGVWNCGRAVGRRMWERRRGAIVTVASNAGATPRTGMAAYSASKAAAAALTRALGLELAPHVRCNVVCPGSTDTPMLRGMWSDPTDESSVDPIVAGVPEEFRLGIPLQRIAVPDDVADVVVFLSGHSSRHVTMQSITVDGGATLGT